MSTNEEIPKSKSIEVLKDFLENPDDYFSRHYPHIPLAFYDAVGFAITEMEKQEGADE